MQKTLILALALGLSGTALAEKKATGKKKPGKAHDHGHGYLSVAVDGLKAQVALEVPADGIFGFEHKPKKDAEKKKVADAMKSLRERAKELFQFPAELACEVSEIDVEADQEDTAGPEEKAKDGHAHADVFADYTFTCKSPIAGKELKLVLMKEFPRIEKLTVQILSGDKQSGTTATAKKDVLKL